MRSRLGRSMLCGLALVLAFSACEESGGEGILRAAARPAVPVSVASVVRKDVPVQLRAVGSVEAFATVSVRSQVEGQLAEVLFEEGQRVKKGDLLMTIDPRPFEAELAQAEANLARDKAEWGNASRDASRRARLFSDGFVSSDENDQAQTRAAAMQGALKADEAAVETARLRLQYCFIRSPIEGHVGRRLVHAGNVVKANDTPLAVINQIRPVLVAFAVPEQELPQIRERAAAGTLSVQAIVAHDETKPVAGELTFIDNAVDRTTGTVLLKGRFTNEDERLWPGQFVDVALTLSVQQAALLVPAQAVQSGQQGLYVYVVENGTARYRNVATSHAMGTEVVITAGVNAEEQVVTDGQIRLADGVAVEIKQRPAAATPAVVQPKA